MKTLPGSINCISIILFSCGSDEAQKTAAEKESYKATKESLAEKRNKKPSKIF